MSWNAFMVGDGLVIDERAVRKIGCGHNDAAGSLAVRSSGYIVSCSGSLERRYGFYRDRRFGQQIEKPCEFGLHLGNVAAEIIKNLLRGGRNVFGIGLERSSVGGKVTEACLLGDCQHLALNTFHFAQAKLVYFIGCHVRGGAAIDVMLIALLAIRPGSDC